MEIRSDPISESTRCGEQVEICLSSDRDCICDSILGSDKKSWTTADLDPLALTDSIAIGSLVYPDYFPSLIEDIPWFLRKSFLEEFFHRDLADETETLRVSAFRIWEFCFSGDLSDL